MLAVAVNSIRQGRTVRCGTPRRRERSDDNSITWLKGHCLLSEVNRALLVGHGTVPSREMTP